jgi:hypothetical protein
VARHREELREREAGPDSPGPEVRVREPWEGYDGMSAPDVIALLTEADEPVLVLVRLYESANRSRPTILRAAETLGPTGA